MTNKNQPSTTRQPRSRRAHLIGLAAAVSAILGLVVGMASSAAANGNGNVRTIDVDVAEDGTRFVIDEAPVFDDGLPAYGNAFMTQGYIYPAGTLTDSNGVNPDGSPEFPDKVIGEWSCSGYFIADGARTTQGSWAYTTQMFAFGYDADNGPRTIVVTGYESGVLGDTVTGAITGGTGRHMTARGEAAQTLLGMNNPQLTTTGINKSVTLRLAK